MDRKMRALAVIVFLLFLVAFFIISNEGIRIIDNNRIEIFYSLYYSWAEKVFDNIIRISGNVIKSDWMP